MHLCTVISKDAPVDDHRGCPEPIQALSFEFLDQSRLMYVCSSGEYNVEYTGRSLDLGLALVIL